MKHIMYGCLMCVCIQLNAQVKSIFRTEPRTDLYFSSQQDAIYQNGYFYLSGSSDDNDFNEPAIIKTDTSGNLVWTTTNENPVYDYPFIYTDFQIRLSRIYFLTDGLYALSYKELWNVDSLSGILKWRIPIEISLHCFGPLNNQTKLHIKNCNLVYGKTQI